MEWTSERQLYSPLCCYLARRRWVGDGTVVAEEVPLAGRRVDLAALTRSGRLLSVEFKVRDSTRALWQATLNTHFFDRSLVVMGSGVSGVLLARATQCGVEVITLTDSGFRRSASGGQRRTDPKIRQRVIGKIRDRSMDWGAYVRSL
jgi:hypothetical protein